MRSTDPWPRSARRRRPGAGRCTATRSPRRRLSYGRSPRRGRADSGIFSATLDTNERFRALRDMLRRQSESAGPLSVIALGASPRSGGVFIRRISAERVGRGALIRPTRRVSSTVTRANRFFSVVVPSEKRKVAGSIPALATSCSCSSGHFGDLDRPIFWLNRGVSAEYPPEATLRHTGGGSPRDPSSAKASFLQIKPRVCQLVGARSERICVKYPLCFGGQFADNRLAGT